MPTEPNEEELSPQESLNLIGKMMDKVQDDALRKVAKKRMLFKLSLSVYIAINGFLVALWYFTTGYYSAFWPIWPMMGWGIGVLLQFIDAYMTSGIFSEDREFEKLKRKARERNRS